jgi:hypothetical protein
LLAGRGLTGGGLGGGGGLVGDAAQDRCLGDPGQGGRGLLAFELGHRAAQGGEHGTLARSGVHAHGHEQAQRLAPAGPGLDLDGAGGHGGEHGQGEHAGQIRWGLGSGGDRGHVLPQPAGHDLDREHGQAAGDPERNGWYPAAPIVRGGVGQLAGQMDQYGRVGVGVGQADAEVDHPPPAGGLGNEVGVVAGVGHGGHGGNEGVEERAAAHIGQLPAVIQFPQHGDRVGGLAAVGQVEHGPPDGPMGGPVEVGLLDEGGDLCQQPSGGQHGAEDGLFGLQVVRGLAVG